MRALRIAAGIGCFVLLTAGQGGCEDSSDAKQSMQQEVMLQQATDAIGMPAIHRFAERRMLKEILELRDHTPATVTYIADIEGKLHKLCDSIGYGLPYATQFTNPLKGHYFSNNGSPYVIPQAEPNGLFSPPSAEGTWVTCLNPETKAASVLYIEPRVIVSPFVLKQAVD
jgi:hypothetical protein